MRTATAYSRTARVILRTGLAVLSLVALIGLTGCRNAPLPQAHSLAARLYAKRCSQCHSLYAPSSMTAAMWRVQVRAMVPRMAAAGEPLSSAEQATIIRYLTRNAGQD